MRIFHKELSKLMILSLILFVQIFFLILLPLTRLEFMLFAVSGIFFGLCKNKLMRKYILIIVLCLYLIAATIDPILKLHLDRFLGVNTVDNFLVSFLLNGLTFSAFFVFFYITRLIVRFRHLSNKNIYYHLKYNELGRQKKSEKNG